MAHNKYLSLLYQRLNGSSSPVLTATCLSYGSLCDFNFQHGDHTPRPILTQNGSNDVSSRKDVPFISKTLGDRGSLPMEDNRKPHMGNRIVTWPMTSRDLERSRSWPQYVYGPTSRKRLEIESRLQWSTYMKCCMRYQMVTRPMTSSNLASIK